MSKRLCLLGSETMDSATSELAVASRCHHNDGMADWQRLGNRIIARRVALGYRTREALTDDADISPRTLGDLEIGRRAKYHPNTIAVLEQALRWAPGSVDQILAGGDATELPTQVGGGSGGAVAMTARSNLGDRTTDEAVVRVMRSPDIDDHTKAKIIRMLIAEQERFARERLAHAEELIQAFRDE
jgi:hypothetical protein